MSDYSDHQQQRIMGRLAKAAFSDATGSIIDTHSAVKVLAITITAEVVGLAMLFVAKDKVIEFIQENGADVLIYGGVLFFFTGFFIAFAIYRLIADRWPHRSAGVLIWVTAVIFGGLNVLLALASLVLEPR